MVPQCCSVDSRQLENKGYNLSVGDVACQPICLDVLDFPFRHQVRYHHSRISSKEEKGNQRGPPRFCGQFQEGASGRNRDSHSWPMCHLRVACSELHQQYTKNSNLHLKNVTLAGKYLINIFSSEVAKLQNWFLFVFLFFKVFCQLLLSLQYFLVKGMLWKHQVTHQSSGCLTYITAKIWTERTVHYLQWMIGHDTKLSNFQ